MASIKDIIQNIRGRADALTTEVVKQTLTELQEQSPVDTGRFRHSWRVGENRVDVSVEPPEENFPFPPQYSGQAKTGNTYYLTNSLDYAPDLAEGSSPQAEAGWILLEADRVPKIAQEALRKLR